MDACRCRDQTWVVEWEDGGRSGLAGFASEKAARLGSLALVAVLSPGGRVWVWRGLELVEAWHWEGLPVAVTEEAACPVECS